MKTVIETCKPRPSIIQGTFNPEVFTAALGPVIQHYKGEKSAIDEIYTDAHIFFKEGTYPTDGLKQTVSNVFRRISGDMSAPSIQRMETAFGGGKTHTLIACVHIANKGKDIAEDVSDIIDKEYLPDPGSVTVVGIAGDEIPVSKNMGDRLVPYTLWGELAYQVGGEGLYRKVQNAAEMFAAPGKDFLDTVLGGRKVLIMLDELAQYAARLEAAQPNKGADQLAAFIMSLNGYAKTHTGIALIVTLAGSADAFSKQTEGLTRLLNKIGTGDLKKDDAVAIAERASKGVTSVLMRDATAVTPVQSGEIAAVLAKRLFISIDKDAARAAADEYETMYRRNSSMLPEEATSVGFHDRMVSTYPFHPTLIDFLNNKLALAENFQGTRGVLRVLAMTVRSIWNRRMNTTVIHVSDIDMQNGTIVDEILGKTGSADLKAVLNADVGSVGSGDLSGGMSNAQKADKENPHPDGMPLHEMTWKVVFLNSLVGRSEGRTSRAFGISQQDAIFEVSTPSMPPSQVRTALEKIDHDAFYLRYEDGKYFAALDPTINSVLARIRTTIDARQISAKLESIAGHLIQDNELFHAEHRVKYPQDIPDKKEKLTVAVVSLDADRINVKDMFFKCGDQTPRVFQNTLVLLVPKTVSVEGDSDYKQTTFLADTAQEEAKSRLYDIAQQVLAIKKLEDNPESYGITRSKLQATDFRDRKNERNLALETTVSEMYTGLYFTATADSFVRKELKKASGEGGAPILTQIRKILLSAGELVMTDNDRFGVAMIRPLGSDYFFRYEDHVKCADILDNFHKLRHWPMLPNRDTLERILREGITSGVWTAYKMSETDIDDIPVEFYSQDKPLPFNVDLVSGGYSIMLTEGAKRRGWTEEDRVPKEKVADAVKTIMQNSGAATVKDVVDGVRRQYSNADDEQVKDVILDIVKEGRYGLYEGSASQSDKPEHITSGFEAYGHIIDDNEVLVTRGTQSERGWLEDKFHQLRIDGNDGARKLFPLLKRIGSMYTRGATSTIDSLDISDLQLPDGGTIRVAVENASPSDIRKLDEFFQVLCEISKVSEETEAELVIENPDDNCQFVKALKE